MNPTDHGCASHPLLRRVGIPLALSLLSAGIMTAADLVTLPCLNNFETADGYVPGPLAADPDWHFDSGLNVAISTEAALGDQAMSFTGAGRLGLDSDPAGVVSGFPVTWLDFYLKPAFSALATLPAFGNTSGASAGIGFVEIDPHGEIYVFDGDGQGGGLWIASGVTTSLTGDQAANWLRLTYRLDYATKRWDLFVDGALVLPDIGFIDPTLDRFEGFSLQGAAGTTRLDAFYAGIDNPVYADTSGDGLPDAWLIAHGLNPAVNQRYADPDGDGLNNLDEYLQGRLPTITDATVALYVNNVTGSDTLYNGLSAAANQPATGYGPKASLGAALSVAGNDGRIIISSGEAVYTESTLPLTGKNLVLRPYGDVRIKRP